MKPVLAQPIHPLYAWVGPPASEKSTHALKFARRLLRKGFDLPFVVRPTKSVRDHEREHEGFLVTKGGERYPSLEVNSASQILPLVEGFGAFWFDEPMLFDDEHLVYEAVVTCRTRGPVLLSGCPATSEMQPFFSSLPRLLAVTDYVTWCKADCDGCGRMNAATRAFYMRGSKTEEVEVGGEQTYQPLCPTCWNNKTSSLLV